jgi:hypothetical protein
MAEQPSLGQFIWLVRRELQWAHELDRDQPLRFDVETVELDLVVGADRTARGGGGLDLKVLGVGLQADAGVEGSRNWGNTVHVVLSAKEVGGTRWQVGAADLEPPPRRAETTPSGNEVGPREQPAGLGATDLEGPPQPAGQ